MSKAKKDESWLTFLISLKNMDCPLLAFKCGQYSRLDCVNGFVRLCYYDKWNDTPNYIYWPESQVEWAEENRYENIDDVCSTAVWLLNGDTMYDNI